MEYANDEMIKNGVTHIHFATCFLLGHPPCPHMANLEKLIAKNHGLNVTFGTDPIPQKYFIHHTNFKTWNNEFLIKALKPTLSSEKIRLNYDPFICQFK